MEFTWAESREVFEAAAQWFVATTAEVGDRWEAPGLGEWDVRALVGHTSRSFVTVEAYLAKPPEQVDVESAALYYRATRSLARGPGVAQRGIDAGHALGADPAAAVAELADRVTALVQRSTGDELMTTIAGGMRLRDYLPTRTFELVVHTCDLAVALAVPVAPPTIAARQAMQLVIELLVDESLAGDALLALTGRRALAANFSVL
jgi:uncharacterized protein (TIGR03083 family)